MDLYLSAQADHFMVRANVLSVFFRASVSRLARFARGPLFFHLESEGGQRLFRPPSKKVGAMAPWPPIAAALDRKYQNGGRQTSDKYFYIHKICTAL